MEINRTTIYLLVGLVAAVALTGVASANECEGTANFTHTPEFPRDDRFAEYTAVTDDPNATYTWYFDGTERSGNLVSYEFVTIGRHNVTLEVTITTTNKTTTSICTKTIKVQSESTNYAPNADFEVIPSTPMVNQTVRFDASASDDMDGEVRSYTWFVDGSRISEERSDKRVLKHTFTSVRSNYRVAIRAFDDDGGSDYTAKTVRVIPERPTEIHLSTNPNGTVANTSLVYVHANETLNVNLSVGRDVILESVNLTPTESGNFTLNVTEGSDLGPEFTLQGELLTYFDVSGSLPRVTNAEFRFFVDPSRVMSPEGVQLYRYNGSGWTSLNTSFVGTSDKGYTYTAESMNLSVFAVAASSVRPSIEVTSVSLERNEISTGDSVGVRVEVTNSGDVNATLQLQLTMDSSVISTGQADVMANSTDTIEFTEVFTEAGIYNIAVNGVEAGTLSVVEPDTGDGSGTDNETDGGMDGTGNGTDTRDGNESGDRLMPGFGVVVALLALITVFFARRFRLNK